MRSIPPVPYAATAECCRGRTQGARPKAALDQVPPLHPRFMYLMDHLLLLDTSAPQCIPATRLPLACTVVAQALVSRPLPAIQLLAVRLLIMSLFQLLQAPLWYLLKEVLDLNHLALFLTNPPQQEPTT